MVAHIRSGLILLILGFFLVRIAQPHLMSYRFEELVRQELDSQRARDESPRMHRRILEQGNGMGLTISPQDIQVERLARGYQVHVSYTAPLNLVVYKTDLKFSLTARTSGSDIL